jgi:hypothetical protein
MTGLFIRMSSLQVICFQKITELLNPFRRIVSLDNQLAVYVLGNFHKAVIIIKEPGFIAIGKNLFHRFPAAGEAPQNIFLPDVVSAVRNTIFYAQQAFVRTVESDIIEADKIALFSCFLRCQFCFLPESLVSCVKLMFLSRHD